MPIEIFPGKMGPYEWATRLIIEYEGGDGLRLALKGGCFIAPVEWVHGSQEKVLLDGDTVAGVEALQVRWSGLGQHGALYFWWDPASLDGRPVFLSMSNIEPWTPCVIEVQPSGIPPTRVEN